MSIWTRRIGRDGDAATKTPAVWVSWEVELHGAPGGWSPRGWGSTPEEALAGLRAQLADEAARVRGVVSVVDELLTEVEVAP